MTAPRGPKQVIDQAIKENRYAELLCYLLIVAFASVGVVSFYYLLATGQLVVTVGAGLTSFVCWPALRYAREIRQQNIAMRLLEVPLGLASNVESAAKALESVFLHTHIQEEKKNEPS